MQSNFISLESIQIASPCRADWNAMQRVQGSDCTRFCPSCGKNVYNLSAMTRDEATRLMEEKEGKMCVRLHRRSDGTVLTSDCPVGQQAQRKQRGRIVQFFVAAVGVATAFLGVKIVLAHYGEQTNYRAQPQYEAGAIMGMPSSAPEIPTPTTSPIIPTQTEHHGNASGNAPSADSTTL